MYDFNALFLEAEPLDVFDVFVRNLEKQRVQVMDFDPWTEEVNTLLFEWEELQNINTLEIRVIPSQIGIRPSTAARSMLPFDLKDFSEGSAMAEYLSNLSKQEKEEPAE